MKTVNTIEQAGELVRELFTNGLIGTTYFKLAISEDEEYKIRVSDHSGRSRNNSSEEVVFSFIANWNKQDQHISNEWELDEDGDFCEEFMSVEDCLEFHIN